MTTYRRYRNLSAAMMAANGQTYNVPVLMGEDGFFLVAATPRQAWAMIAAGYERI